MRPFLVVVVLAAAHAAGADKSAGAPDAWISRCEAILRDAQKQIALQNTVFNKGEVRRTGMRACVPAPAGGTGGVWCQEVPPDSPPGVEFVVEISEHESFRAAIGRWRPNAVPHSWHRHTASVAFMSQVWEDRAWGARRNGLLAFVQAAAGRLAGRATFDVLKKALDACAAIDR